jgi:alpha-glucosidase
MKVKHLVGAFLCVLGCYACSSPKTEVQSPDGHIKMTLTVDENGKPFYNVSVDDSLLIENSAMGFTAANGIILAEGFQVKNTTFSSEDETWTQPWGENKKNRNHYNEMAVSLTNEDQVQLTLRFRVFDDGIGFRYEYTVPTVDSLLITDELTTFHFVTELRGRFPPVPKHMNYSINNNRFPKWKRLIHLSHSRLRMEFTEVYTKPLCMIFRK